MTRPTPADRKRAIECIWGTLPRAQVEAVARALAEERAKAREPFLALAERWASDDGGGHPPQGQGSLSPLYARWLHQVARDAS